MGNVESQSGGTGGGMLLRRSSAQRGGGSGASKSGSWRANSSSSVGGALSRESKRETERRQVRQGLNLNPDWPAMSSVAHTEALPYAAAFLTLSDDAQDVRWMPWLEAPEKLGVPRDVLQKQRLLDRVFFPDGPYLDAKGQFVYFLAISASAEIYYFAVLRWNALMNMSAPMPQHDESDAYSLQFREWCAWVLVSRVINPMASARLLQKLRQCEGQANCVPRVMEPPRSNRKTKDAEDALMRCIPHAGYPLSHLFRNVLRRGEGALGFKSVFDQILMGRTVVVVADSPQNVSLVVYALQLLYYPLERDLPFVLWMTDPELIFTALCSPVPQVLGMPKGLWETQLRAKMMRHREAGSIHNPNFIEPLQDEDNPQVIWDFDENSVMVWPASGAERCHLPTDMEFSFQHHLRLAMQHRDSHEADRTIQRIFVTYISILLTREVDSARLDEAELRGLRRFRESSAVKQLKEKTENVQNIFSLVTSQDGDAVRNVEDALQTSVGDYMKHNMTLRGQSILHDAATSSPAMLEFICDYFVPKYIDGVDIRDRFGRTPLMTAMEQPSILAIHNVRYLMSRGASLNVLDRRLLSPASLLISRFATLMESKEKLRMWKRKLATETSVAANQRLEAQILDAQSDLKSLDWEFIETVIRGTHKHILNCVSHASHSMRPDLTVLGLAIYYSVFRTEHREWAKLIELLVQCGARFEIDLSNTKGLALLQHFVERKQFSWWTRVLQLTFEEGEDEIATLTEALPPDHKKLLLQLNQKEPEERLEDLLASLLEPLQQETTEAAPTGSDDQGSNRNDNQTVALARAPRALSRKSSAVVSSRNSAGVEDSTPPVRAGRRAARKQSAAAGWKRPVHRPELRRSAAKGKGKEEVE